MQNYYVTFYFFFIFLSVAAKNDIMLQYIVHATVNELQYIRRIKA